MLRHIVVILGIQLDDLDVTESQNVQQGNEGLEIYGIDALSPSREEVEGVLRLTRITVA